MLIRDGKHFSVGELNGRFLHAALSQPYFLTHSKKTQTALCLVITCMGHHTDKICYLYQLT
jgi:hypothetical protein